jgi:trans-aconitate 2-methyltransferase
MDKGPSVQTWYEPNRFDLIFANASLHWIDDHESLTKRLLEAVKPSGIFASQMPTLYNQPVAQAIHDVSESPAWKSHRLSDRYTLRTHTPGEYYDWLAPLSKQLQIWENGLFSRTSHSRSHCRFLLQHWAQTASGGIAIGRTEGPI